MDTDGRFARWLRKPAHAGNDWAILFIGPWVLGVVLYPALALWNGTPITSWWIFPVTALVAFLVWRPWIMEALDRRAVHWVAARERENERRDEKAAANYWRPEYRRGHKPV